MNAFAQSTEKIKIGVVAALSGEDSAVGNDVKDAIVFADTIYGHGRYQLMIEDDQCNGRNGVSVAQKFIHLDGVRYVMGFSCSASTLPAAPLYEKAHVVTMVAAASSPRISEAGDYMFRTSPNDSDAGRILGEYAGTHNKKIGLISEETDYAEHLGDVFESEATHQGAEVIRENFLPNTYDFRALLVRLRQKKIDSLFINAQAEKTFAAILSQVRQMAFALSLYGAYWPSSPVILDIAKTDLEGVVFVDTPSLRDVLNEEGNKIVEAYRKQGGVIRGTEAMFATAIEAFRSVITAIESGEDPKTYLYKHTFHGIFGDYTFDQKGDIKGLTLQLKTIKDGKPVSFSEIP